MVVGHFSHSLVIQEGEPAELGVRVQELADLTLPEADRVVAVHQIDENVFHLVHCWIGRLHSALLESLTEAIVALPILGRPVTQQFKVSNFDLNLVVGVVGG